MRCLKRSLKRFLSMNISHFSRATYAWLASKENTKCNASRCYMVKSRNFFSLGVNYNCVFTLKEEVLFSNLVFWKKKAPYQSLNLWNIIQEMPYTNHIIFSIFFKFSIPKERFCDACSFSFSLLLLKMSLKCY